VCPLHRWGKGVVHTFSEIRRGVRAKLTSVGNGELPNISICEARFPPPHLLIIIVQSLAICQYINAPLL